MARKSWKKSAPNKFQKFPRLKKHVNQKKKS